MTNLDRRATDTDRLSLRVPVVADFADSAAMWGDTDIVRHIGSRAFTREECWSRHLRYVGHWQVLGFGFWSVRERASGRFVGEVGLANFERDITPSFDGAPEIGWVLAPWAHGHGYATEAARAALAWVARELHAPRTVCIIAPENTASLRVAAKLGYTEFARTDYKNSAVVVLERLTG